MSMLAERRRKTKYVINPTKKPLWTTDSSGIKFGKELMEKMGWSAGKGLGANEQGIQEPLKVSYKNDNKGMGFKGNEENWIEYQDEFNSLLNQLASSSDNNVKTIESEKSEMTSLEEKSKHSKARVHYQKFTRGKDLSKYSEKDLSCILGTGKKKKESNEIAPVEEIPSNNETYETSFGVTTINSGSYKDYFKKKWTNNNNKKSENSKPEELVTNINEEHQVDEKTDEDVFSTSKKRHRESREDSLGNENVEKEIKKHKKKRKKSDSEEEIPSKKEKKLGTHENDFHSQKYEDFQSEVNIQSDDCPEAILQSKKKKKKKRECEEPKEEESMEQEPQTEVIVDEKIKNKKRKTESGEVSEVQHKLEINGDVVEEDLQNETQKENSTKKKKKKKEKRPEEFVGADNNCEVRVNEDVTAEVLKNYTEITFEEKTSKKKKKKKEKDGESLEEVKNAEETENPKSELEYNEEQPKKKKKKKKEKEVENSDKILENMDESTAKEEPKSEDAVKEIKKKKKKEENIENKIIGVEGEVEHKSLIDEENLTKKKKKKNSLKESEKDEPVMNGFSEAEVDSTKNRKRKKSEEKSEVQSQPEEIKKKAKKEKKKDKEEVIESEACASEERALDSGEKVSKKKKKKRNAEEYSEDACGNAKGEEREGSDKKEEKENKDGETVNEGESEKSLIHTHKAALFQMKKPFFAGLSNCSTTKAMDLICGAEIEKFKGSNLEKIPGYGSKRKAKKNEEKR